MQATHGTSVGRGKRAIGFSFIIFLSLVLIAFPVIAQEAADADEDMIELNLPPEVELSLLIQIISEELELQVMSDDRVGNQRVRLLIPGPIPRSSLRGLLESTLRMKGLALIEGDEPGWLRVTEAKDLIDIAPLISEGPEDAGDVPPSTILTRVFEFEHVDAQRANDVIAPFLTKPGGNAMLIGEQRMLIVTDYASNVGRIEELIALIDRPRQEVEVRFRLIVNLEARQAADELQRILQAQQRAGGNTAQAQSPGPGSGGIEIVQQERTNQLVLIGPPEVIAAADELLDLIDVALGLETRIYRFRTASPERVTTLVEHLIDEVSRERFFRSVVDEGNGLLIVTTTPAIHEQVAAIQRDLDREIEAAQPVVRYYKLLNAKAEEVFATIAEMRGVGLDLYPGEEWQSEHAPGRDPHAAVPLEGQSPATQQPDGSSEPPIWFDPTQPDRRRGDRSQGLLSQNRPRRGAPLASGIDTGDANIVVNPGTNTIIISATEDRQDYYAQIIRQLDRRRPQVMIEVTIVAVSVSDGQSVGVEISRFGDEDDDPRIISFSSFGLNDSSGGSGGAGTPALLNASLGFNGAIISGDIADVVIKALRTDGQTEVIAAPKILVNDNASGTLTSVTDAPFASINASNTVSSTSFGGFESAGLTINMSPQISEGNHLKLTYSIELSTFGEGGSATTPPPRQRQQISSEVTIPDGHTIIVGGLKRNDLTETITRVPILGQIPWLEYLFSSRSNNASDATLFVFIRPIILRDDAFEDLKYLSSRELDLAGLPQDYPSSSPLLMAPGN